MLNTDNIAALWPEMEMSRKEYSKGSNRTIGKNLCITLPAVLVSKVPAIFSILCCRDCLETIER